MPLLCAWNDYVPTLCAYSITSIKDKHILEKIVQALGMSRGSLVSMTLYVI